MPSESTVTWAVTSVAGIYAPPGLPFCRGLRGRSDALDALAFNNQGVGGEAGEELTPSASAFSPSQRTISQMEAT